MERVKVFLDSSILVTAVLSSSGGSFYILTQFQDKVEFQINEYVLEETVRVLDTKLSSAPDLKRELFLLIGLAGVRIFSNPSAKELKQMRRIINLEDAPIFASALKYASFLLTLDHDFFQERVMNFSRLRKFAILKPREFISRFRE